MTRSALARLILAIVSLAVPLLAQDQSDLQAQLRSATGSNTFQIGEVIPLEVVLSSPSPNRYREPCTLFRESNFGFPQCRFFNSWSFTITPDAGWVDLAKEFPSGPIASGGPTFEVPYRDLSSQPESFFYLLTHRFRFDKPGEYRVQLSLNVGLDDETTQFKAAQDPANKTHSVTVTPEIMLQIVPATAEWQRKIVRKGSAAYSGPVPPSTDPPSPERLRYKQDTEALCNLGTPEAARTLAGFLSRGQSDVQPCLEQTPSPAAAIQEMQRLLVDPDTGVNADMFSELVRLLGITDFKTGATYMISQPAVDRERDALLAALPLKRGEAQLVSLLTMLQWPPRAAGTPFASPYELPFSLPVIAAVVANFDRFPWNTREWLLGDAWPRVRSPLMLPLVKRLAEAGTGPALLRWLELDPASAEEFVRKEVVRPVPRFSSFYLRLPDPSLPGQEAQIAANFLALTQERDLFNAATLLHRYATRAVLPGLLPFITAKHAAWPCSVQYPILAYLLKVSPADATPLLERALQEINSQPWQTTFFSDIGFLEPGPVLERLALAQIESGKQPLARDAIDYLRQHGSAATKPLVWQQLVLWHERVLASQAGKGESAQPNEEYLQNALVSALTEAFTSARAWVMSPEDERNIQTLLGDQTASGLSCRFRCGDSLGASPRSYSIYSKPTHRPFQPRPEYMYPTERLEYFINQYHCPDLRTLQEKLLQFPAGSSFDFAYDFSPADRDELVEISDFLRSHGYKVRNPQKWNFLGGDSPQ
jgi:hypothetical protein